MSSKKKIIVVAITTVALSVGSIGFASASLKSSAMKTTVITTFAAGITNPMAHGKPARGAEIASVLAGLVTSKVITQSQSDSITAAFAATKLDDDSNRPAPGADKGRGMGDLLAIDRAAVNALIARTLGTDTATVTAALKAGKSLAQIAGDKTPALITALVAYLTVQIDAAAAAVPAKITAAQATAMKANLLANVTATVNAVRPEMGPGKGNGRGHTKDGKKDKPEKKS